MSGAYGIGRARRARKDLAVGVSPRSASPKTQPAPKGLKKSLVAEASYALSGLWVGWGGVPGAPLRFAPGQILKGPSGLLPSTSAVNGESLLYCYPDLNQAVFFAFRPRFF